MVNNPRNPKGNNMTDAPNRIWVSADLTYWIEDPLGLSETDIEYTRTDIAQAHIAKLIELANVRMEELEVSDARIAELEALAVKAYTAMETTVCDGTLGLDQRSYMMVRHAVSAIEETTAITTGDTQCLKL
jgi:hypothetical protein